MKKEEYDLIEKMKSNKKLLVTGEWLRLKTDRTLLYGYTCDRDTWHVYLKDGKIYTVYYIGNGYPLDIDVTENEQYIPNKRLYPECCDYEFCKILRRLDIDLPFTTWQDRPEQKQFWGRTL